METNARKQDRYALSFTTGGLFAREAAVLSPIYTELRDWAKVRDLVVKENLLQARAYRTGVRLARETIKRLSTLSDYEVDLLSEVTATEREHLMWAAACRSYEFIGEFAEEVLRERFLTLTGTISHDDYDAFYRLKAMWHDELDSISKLTYKKLREVLFKMMVEAGLLDVHGRIEPTVLSARVADCLAQRVPSDIRFFPTREVQ